MFANLSRSWQFATTSYKVLWNHQRLLVLPLLSTLAAAVVVASFVAPLWASGALEAWANPQGNGGPAHDPVFYVLLFLFYFCNYFVVVFFNSALVSCVMQVLNGEDPSVQAGLAQSAKRLPQILAWALVSAFVGVVLKVIENAHEKAGQIVAAILGTAWSVMTYFVVPVLVLDGVGPIEAVKRSTKTLTQTWGTALVGGFSLGLVGLIILIPLYLLGIAAIVLGVMSGTLAGAVLGGAVGVMLIALASIINSAAGTVFTALLYSFATKRTIPAEIDHSQFAQAFVPKS